jgi:hypothetical protein
MSLLKMLCGKAHLRDAYVCDMSDHKLSPLCVLVSGASGLLRGLSSVKFTDVSGRLVGQIIWLQEGIPPDAALVCGVEFVAVNVSELFKVNCVIDCV